MCRVPEKFRSDLGEVIKSRARGTRYKSHKKEIIEMKTLDAISKLKQKDEAVQRLVKRNSVTIEVYTFKGMVQHDKP